MNDSQVHLCKEVMALQKIIATLRDYFSNARGRGFKEWRPTADADRNRLRVTNGNDGGE